MHYLALIITEIETGNLAGYRSAAAVFSAMSFKYFFYHLVTFLVISPFFPTTCGAVEISHYSKFLTMIKYTKYEAKTFAKCWRKVNNSKLNE